MTNSKKFLSVAVLLFTTAYTAFAQTIVSTEIQKRNLVIEEFTGNGCMYCPWGHERVNAYSDSLPGRVVHVNIHQGAYAKAYITEFADSLAKQTNLTGYPCGTLNRQVKNCKIDAPTISTSAWYKTADSIINEESPVNIAATAEYDYQTNSFKIYTEIYYTKDVNQDFNLLNIVLLQDDIIGTQENYQNHNKPQTDKNGYYHHNRMLRYMLTGQWGDTIALNTDGIIPAGTFITKEYTYEIPLSITEENIVLPDLSFAIFISDGAYPACDSLKGPNIHTGINVIPTFSVMTKINGINIQKQYNCEDSLLVFADIKNVGTSTIYDMNLSLRNKSLGFSKSAAFTNDSVLAGCDTALLLGKIPYSNNKTDTIEVEIEKINNYSTDNIIKKNFVKELLSSYGEYSAKFIIKTDNKGSDITWNIYDPYGNIIHSGGPYMDSIVIWDTVLLTQVDKEGCYYVEILDKSGDGINGRFKILDIFDNVIISKSLENIAYEDIENFRLQCDSLIYDLLVSDIEQTSVRVNANVLKPTNMEFSSLKFQYKQDIDSLPYITVFPMGYINETIYADITKLQPDTQYRLRAYYVFPYGDTLYSEPITFKTMSNSSICDVAESEVISIYPNPAHEIVTLDIGRLTLNKNEAVTIVNNSGQVVYKSNIQSPKFNINVSDFEAGVYYINVGKFTQPLIIE
ncbi:MAG: Omp28-related outer membrane protein [Bacteroidales bacterium]|nr:Omp28-related outer membrane protein [Bacteroidales bacterium]